jgi:hypothetical protein
LKTLADVITNLSAIECAYFGEGCAVAFEDQGHTSPTRLKVTGHVNGNINFLWQSPNRKGSWKDKKRIAELGAVAVACVVVTKFTEYEIVEQSPASGTRIDYWLGKGDEFNLFAARLEVSGINAEKGSNTVQARTTQKLKRAKNVTSNDVPLYTVITEFKTPVSQITYRK